MRELILSAGPARYLGGSIETFALPYGAFIVIACVLYYILKRPHSVPRMKYLAPAHQTSTGTREPGTAGVITLRGRMPAAAPAAGADTAVPGGQPPHATETTQQTNAAADTVSGTEDGPAAPAAGDQPEADA